MASLVRVYATEPRMRPMLCATFPPSKVKQVPGFIAYLTANRTDQEVMRGVRFSTVEIPVYWSKELKKYVTIPE